MSVFGNYARYYDLLYRDKPYREEAAYVRSLVLEHAPHTQDVVELGCGTGAHAEHLAHAGWTVRGVDLSEWMLQRAHARRDSLPTEVGRRLAFSQGDVRTCKLGARADAVVSLFHVMSYQSGNDDVRAMFATAQAHVRPGGVFIFDIWYGPAVLTDRPGARVKELEDEEVLITRIATPVMHPVQNLVDVHYRILVREKKTGRCEETTETHRMRYLFSTEIEAFAAQAGFRVADAHEWMTRRRPGFDTWSVCFVCQA